MLVDDDQDLLLALSAALRRHAFDVVAATDAVSAISVAIKESPDVIVLDIGLPGGEGTVVIERLRGLPQLAGVPVIILSGRDPAEYRERLLAAGAAAYFAKPVVVETLAAAIDAALAEGGGASPAEPDDVLVGKLVLLVDDDRDLLFALAAVLRQRGAGVAVATDAVSAVSVAVKQRPNVVVLDVGLPGGEATLVMQRFNALPQLAGTPVVILSGRDPEQYRQTMLDAGAVDYLTKPVETGTLLAALRRAVGEA